MKIGVLSDTHDHLVNIKQAVMIFKREGIEFTVSLKPRHDSTAHFRSALEYLALGLRDNVGRNRVIRDKFKPDSRFVKRKSIGY